ncbi:MAG: rod shape-determining protein MreC [Actinomycetota bacterium]|nr:rod shape-determining protein MreC [Actinomycetota bacterium]
MVVRPRGRSTRLLVFILVAVSIGVISLDYHQPENGPLSGVGRMMSGAMAPLQRAVTAVTRPVGNFFNGLAHLPTNQQTIDRLNQQVLDNKAQLAAIAELQRRLKELELQADVVDQFPSTMVQADVIADGLSNDDSGLTIGKGSTSGIGVNMPVVTGGPDGARLVGKIISVTPTTAAVQLVNDQDFGAAAQLASTGATGQVQGEGLGSDYLKMNLVDVGSEVQAGDAVLTKRYVINGQAGLFPSGIVIGTVSRTLPAETGDPNLFVEVQPAVDLSNLDYVAVIETGSGG